MQWGVAYARLSDSIVGRIKTRKAKIWVARLGKGGGWGGRGGCALSLPSLRAFFAVLFNTFLLNDFSPLSWSLQQAKWVVHVKTFLSDERQPEVMDFLQYSPVVWLSFLVKSVSRSAKTLSITNLAASRYIKRKNAPLAVGMCHSKWGPNI